MNEKNIKRFNVLQNKVRVLEADQLSRYRFACENIDKCGQDRYLGSAVTITIKNINIDKNTVIEEVMITDGLSPETIAAIKADIIRSYETKINHPINKLPGGSK